MGEESFLKRTRYATNDQINDAYDLGGRDATKHIKDVWDTHHHAIHDFGNVKHLPQYKPMFDLIFDDLVQAIKADCAAPPSLISKKSGGEDEEYEPYGKEWEREMLKMTKMELIDFIRRIKTNEEKGGA